MVSDSVVTLRCSTLTFCRSLCRFSLLSPELVLRQCTVACCLKAYYYVSKDPIQQHLAQFASSKQELSEDKASKRERRMVIPIFRTNTVDGQTMSLVSRFFVQIRLTDRRCRLSTITKSRRANTVNYCILLSLRCCKRFLFCAQKISE